LTALFARLLRLLGFSNHASEQQGMRQKYQYRPAATQTKRPPREARRVYLHALFPRMAPKLYRNEMKIHS
jgi:hypothetical protein